MFDLPPMPDGPPNVAHECVLIAASAHQVPPAVLVAIRQQEAGASGKISKNTNGSVDMGEMQVNDIHIKDIERKWGLTREDVTGHSCANFFVAADLLKQHLVRNKGALWESVGDYHSRTPKFHKKYRGMVKKRFNRLARRFPSYVAWLDVAAKWLKGVDMNSPHSMTPTKLNRMITHKPLKNPYLARRLSQGSE